LTLPNRSLTVAAQFRNRAATVRERSLLAPHYTSVILLRGEPLVPEVRGPALPRALEECRLELERGAIVSLDWSDRPRARVLPLG
jgi:hypothetical protein